MSRHPYRAVSVGLATAFALLATSLPAGAERPGVAQLEAKPAPPIVLRYTLSVPNAAGSRSLRVTAEATAGARLAAIELAAGPRVALLPEAAVRTATGSRESLGRGAIVTPLSDGRAGVVATARGTWRGRPVARSIVIPVTPGTSGRAPSGTPMRDAAGRPIVSLPASEAP